MEEVPLREALFAGFSAAKKRGVWFSPNLPILMNDLYRTEKNAGTLILPDGKTNYNLINIETFRLPKSQTKPESTAEELWGCVKEHYGITTATAFLAVGQIPIPKPWLGHVVIKGSSYFTNPISQFGLRFFPGKVLRVGTSLARGSKAVFGTIRVFGILGRANVAGFIGFAILDVISLAVCMNRDK